jgi:Lrp/AsnC family leucine-responsive transcriptional regulator
MKMKDIDFKILFELIKNSKISDRELGKILGVSQPTVSRKRTRLEKEVIDSYTAIPKLEKIGYEILAVTLVKTPSKFASDEHRKNAHDRSMNWLAKQPNVIMGSECLGMGMSGIMISLHKGYSDLDKFLSDHRSQLGDLLEDVQTFIVNLSGNAYYRKLNFKYLAEAT